MKYHWVRITLLPGYIGRWSNPLENITYFITHVEGSISNQFGNQIQPYRDLGVVRMSMDVFWKLPITYLIIRGLVKIGVSIT